MSVNEISLSVRVVYPPKRTLLCAVCVGSHSVVFFLLPTRLRFVVCKLVGCGRLPLVFVWSHVWGLSYQPTMHELRFVLIPEIPF
jgi:hypothetical protein